jgi:hypothetical protein
MGATAPQSALVGIAVATSLEIVFDTVKTTRKYRNLVARPACSFVIGGWDSERTIQYEGAAEELEGEARTPYLDLYLQVFPDGVDRLAWPGIVHFVVRPSWIRFTDYHVVPPAIREFTF